MVFVPLNPVVKSITPPAEYSTVFARSVVITSITRVPLPKSKDPAGTVFSTMSIGPLIPILAPVRSIAL